MLPPIQIAQSGVAYQARRPGDSDLVPQSNGSPGTSEDVESLGLDLRSAIAGRVSILLLSGPEKAAESFAIMAELLGRSLGIPRKEGESQAVYMRRLADALNSLPPTNRQIVEQQLAQLFNGLALRTIVAAFADPAGPDAAIMTLHLEVADGEESRRFANSSFVGYQAEPDDGLLKQNTSSGSPSRASSNASPLDLHILTLSGSAVSENKPLSENASRQASTTRPTIDIRGKVDGTDDASPAVMAENSSTSSRSSRPFSHVTIEIGGRAKNPPTSDVSASPWHTLRFDDATRSLPMERGEAAGKLPQRHRDNGPDGVQTDQTPARSVRTTYHSSEEITATVTSGLIGTMQPPAPSNDAVSDDAFSKFLRASLRPAFESSIDGESQLWTPTVGQTITEEQRRNSTGHNSMVADDPESQALEQAVTDPVPVKPEPSQDLDIAPQQILAQRNAADPIGYPVVGYPYLDDEETDRPRADDSRREESDNNSQDESDQQSAQDHDTDEQSFTPVEEEVTTVSLSETGSEVGVEGRHGGLDSANELYWKMAGWA